MTRRDQSAGLDDRYIEAHPGLASGDGGSALEWVTDEDGHPALVERRPSPRPCPYCDCVMSAREAVEQGACNDCYQP